ncbi:hypothetical protein CLF_106880 [Clonorchis sinensis]|uniref:Uncharacterized protein n=1 Tax=Clonorchis sinensis TaxID=79923 RepID=G7YQ85_CLOSI|nr:hypothetical protein CLF_106880 [Clonorchis sinensis]
MDILNYGQVIRLGMVVAIPRVCGQPRTWKARRGFLSWPRELAEVGRSHFKIGGILLVRLGVSGEVNHSLDGVDNSKQGLRTGYCPSLKHGTTRKGDEFSKARSLLLLHPWDTFDDACGPWILGLKCTLRYCTIDVHTAPSLSLIGMIEQLTLREAPDARWKQVALFKRFLDVEGVEETQATNNFGYVFKATNIRPVDTTLILSWSWMSWVSGIRLCTSSWKADSLFPCVNCSAYPENGGGAASSENFCHGQVGGTMASCRARFWLRRHVVLLPCRKSYQEAHSGKVCKYCAARTRDLSLILRPDGSTSPSNGCTCTIKLVHFCNVANNRLENATGRLRNRVNHRDTLEHAIQKDVDGPVSTAHQEGLAIPGNTCVTITTIKKIQLFMWLPGESEAVARGICGVEVALSSMAEGALPIWILLCQISANPSINFDKFYQLGRIELIWLESYWKSHADDVDFLDVESDSTNQQNGDRHPWDNVRKGSGKSLTKTVFLSDGPNTSKVSPVDLLQNNRWKNQHCDPYCFVDPKRACYAQRRYEIRSDISELLVGFGGNIRLAMLHGWHTVRHDHSIAVRIKHDWMGLAGTGDCAKKRAIIKRSIPIKASSGCYNLNAAGKYIMQRSLQPKRHGYYVKYHRSYGNRKKRGQWACVVAVPNNPSDPYPQRFASVCISNWTKNTRFPLCLFRRLTLRPLATEMHTPRLIISVTGLSRNRSLSVQ